jgi:hypothetical protein
MIISHRHRFIFIKTHKTAGSSLEVALARECAADDIVSHMEDNLSTGVPRNYGPTSRLGALYGRSRLLRKLLHRHSPLLGAYYYEHMPAWRVRELLGSATWEAYFCFCVERNPWDKVVSYYLWKRHGQQRRMPAFRDWVLEKSHRLPADSTLYCDDTGALLVDRVFQFRDLPAALQQLREQIGLQLPEPLPREKAAVAPRRRPYTDYYDDDTRERVARLFAREITLFGYRFGE